MWPCETNSLISLSNKLIQDKSLPLSLRSVGARGQGQVRANALWRKQGIREIKVCKKCPKVNPYCDAIFDPILFKPFLDGAKWPKFCAKYFSLSQKSNIGSISFICLWHTMKGWSDNFEIRTMYTSCHVEKKPKKHKNYLGSPSLSILHLKYKNICHLWLDRCWDIWRFWNWIFYERSTRPQQFSDSLFSKCKGSSED